MSGYSTLLDRPLDRYRTVCAGGSDLDTRGAAACRVLHVALEPPLIEVIAEPSRLSAADTYISSLVMHYGISPRFARVRPASERRSP